MYLDIIMWIGVAIGLWIAHVVSKKVSNYTNPVIKFKIEDPSAKVPSYQTKGAAGFDFYAIEDCQIKPKETKIIPTGLSAEVPDGYELQIRCRSSIAAKTKIRVANGVGTVDSDYRGLIGVILDNTGDEVFNISKGDRIAQGVVARSLQPKIKEVKSLSSTKRGAGGFGSTGK